MTPRTVCLDLRGDAIRPLRAIPPKAVLCLGNFDGVHIAHAALIREGRRLAAEITRREGASANAPCLCGVFCFFRPSGDYFLPEGTHPTHLTTLTERIHAIRALGADLVWLCDFPSVQKLSPLAFMEMLRDACHGIAVVCGYNHRFGKGAAGTTSLLECFFGHENVSVLPALEVEGRPVSSTRIRACLTVGDVETAERLLGRPYALKAKVLHGKSLGHTWGFPTANQNFPPDRLVPAHGVYAVTCVTPSGTYPGVANVGLRPTTDGAAARINCETHIIGFSGDLYGRTVRVEFRKFLRPEQRFDSIDELQAAIRRDTDTAEAYVRERFSNLLA